MATTAWQKTGGTKSDVPLFDSAQCALRKGYYL